MLFRNVMQMQKEQSNLLDTWLNYICKHQFNTIFVILGDFQSPKLMTV